MLKRLRRFFSWDSRSKNQRTMNHEEVIAQQVHDGQLDSKTPGADITFGNRFTR